MWGDLACPFKTNHGLRLREALWSAVAAATAFRLCFIPQSRNHQNEKGGSCCYRTPMASFARMKGAHIELPPTGRVRLRLRRAGLPFVAAVSPPPYGGRRPLLQSRGRPYTKRLAYRHNVVLGRKSAICHEFSSYR